MKPEELVDFTKKMRDLGVKSFCIWESGTVKIEFSNHAFIPKEDKKPSYLDQDKEESEEL